jgi:Ca2+-binding EF-hand superfamily protein
VAKISGDVDHVFREVDLNDDGHIDREELEQLFVRLECHLSPQELDEVFRQLDEDNDGKVRMNMRCCE